MTELYHTALCDTNKPQIDTMGRITYTESMNQVFAQVSLSDPSVYAPAKNFSTLGSLVSVIVQNAFVFAGIIAFVLLIFGGLGFIMSAGSGDTKKMEQGQKAMTGAVVGLIIVVASFWIVQIIEKLTGISLLPLK